MRKDGTASEKQNDVYTASHMTTNTSSPILVTGGAGFYGEYLKNALLQRGFKVVSVDRETDASTHPLLEVVQADIRDEKAMDALFARCKFAAVFHCAAVLAHAVRDRNDLWTSNVDGTRVIAECAKKHGVKKIVFTSSNCLWGEPMGRALKEDDAPCPVEIYGRSKLEGEKILWEYTNDMSIIIIRCCTIMASGRLGLLAILFEFIDEGRKVWVVGGGKNVYQFIAAEDLVDACIRSLDYPKSAIFHIGSDNVHSFREVYQAVIDRAKTGARVASLPGWLIIPVMKVTYRLGLSPMGPYQYKMIAENSLFDTSKIKKELGWQPTLTNEQMLWNAYEYYHQNRSNIESRTGVSAHKQAAKMGIIRVLKWLS